MSEETTTPIEVVATPPEAVGPVSSRSSSSSSTSLEKVEDARQQLLEAGLQAFVVDKLEHIYTTGKLEFGELDARAMEALREFPSSGALAVLDHFEHSNLEHVSNKSAYLCGIMKTFRQHVRQQRVQQQQQQQLLLHDPVMRNRRGCDDKLVAPNLSFGGDALFRLEGPDTNSLRALLDRTHYNLDVTTGQRKYGGPPPNWEGPPPPKGCEVFCGKLPRDAYEDELVPLLEKFGRIYDLRLMIDPQTGLNRGYAFVTYATRDDAKRAVKELDEYELRKGKRMGVTISFNNRRLFVGNIPKMRSREDLLNEFTLHSPGLKEVIVYSSPDDHRKNRGFCFLEYDSHRSASLAKRRLESGRVKMWSCDIIVDWADPQDEPDEDTMSRVKVLYVRNLSSSVSESTLRELFEVYGEVERAKKLKDYAFIHFKERQNAVNAMDALTGTKINGVEIEVNLAKPPGDKRRKEEVLRRREQRLLRTLGTPQQIQQGPPLPSPLAVPGSYFPMYASHVVPIAHLAQRRLPMARGVVGGFFGGFWRPGNHL